jgi:DNA-binding NarL/FixJ family response regulator
MTSGHVLKSVPAVIGCFSPGGSARSDHAFLTDREFEILDRLAHGLRNDAISARMGIILPKRN